MSFLSELPLLGSELPADYDIVQMPVAFLRILVLK